MNQEIERRRTFAIISHPDAGKTTLTEKFLLFGGQIQVAGAVKNNKIKKTATSDWMEIEKQRGISVSTSVMEFDYTPEGKDIEYKVNILDTPGHQDFAEDTFRTLTAVDSAIIVVDGAKGVETQTRKLMSARAVILSICSMNWSRNLRSVSVLSHGLLTREPSSRAYIISTRKSLTSSLLTSSE